MDQAMEHTPISLAIHLRLQFEAHRPHMNSIVTIDGHREGYILSTFLDRTFTLAAISSPFSFTGSVDAMRQFINFMKNRELM
jgi:hypothetical protein